jgi:hypothetical protein
MIDGYEMTADLEYCIFKAQKPFEFGFKGYAQLIDLERSP